MLTMLTSGSRFQGIVGRYGASLYWAETSGHRARPRLPGRLDVDVAVVGAGFTGLWTAYQLLVAEPMMRLVVLEQADVGFGASGRTAGCALPVLDVRWSRMRRRYGDTETRAVYDALKWSLLDLDRTVASERIDCDWANEGIMVVAADRAQLQRVDTELASVQELGLAGFTPLSAEDAQARVASPTFLGGWLQEPAGIVHPAKLAKGLARAIEQRGASVYEHSRVRKLEDHDGRMRLTCGDGYVDADQVVLATGATSGQQRQVQRSVVPVFSYVAVTEPLTDQQWEALHWDRSLGVEDRRNFFHAYRPTADGRILWNGADAVIPFPTRRISRCYDQHRKAFARLGSTFRITFPQLADVEFTHRWGGPVGIAAGLRPLVGTLVDGRVHHASAYHEHGIVPSHLAGKIITDKILRRGPTPPTELCFVDREPPRLPPDPIRWIGATLTRRALRRQDEQAARTADALEQPRWTPATRPTGLG
jgi:glycine/D-amino acid oxidase-like deaminating enzyme